MILFFCRIWTASCLDSWNLVDFKSGQCTAAGSRAQPSLQTFIETISKWSARNIPIYWSCLSVHRAAAWLEIIFLLPGSSQRPTARCAFRQRFLLASVLTRFFSFLGQKHRIVVVVVFPCSPTSLSILLWPLNSILLHTTSLSNCFPSALYQLAISDTSEKYWRCCLERRVMERNVCVCFID